MTKAEDLLPLEFQEWARKYKKLAKRDLYAGRSWKRLSDLGFSDELISFGLYLACDFPNSPGYLWQAGKQRESRRKATQAKQLLSRLESMRNEVCEFLSIPRDLREHQDSNDDNQEPEMSFECTDTEVSEQEEYVTEEVPNLAAWNPGKDGRHDSEIAIVCEVLDDPEVHFEEPSVTRAKERQMIEAFDLAIAKVRHLRDELHRAGSKRNATPSYYLAFGLHLIRFKATRPLYRDYANLLNIAYQTFDRDDLQCGEESVRKTYQRFIKRNPGAFRFALLPGVSVAVSMIFDYRHR